MPSPIAPTETQTKEDEDKNSTSPRLDVAENNTIRVSQATFVSQVPAEDEETETKRSNTIRVSQEPSLSVADKARFNGKSQIGMKEFVQTQSDKDKAVAQNKQLKKIVAVLSVAVLVLCAGAFAASFAAIQMAKESHVKDGVMYASEDTSTQDMANGAAQYEVRSVVSTGTSSVKISFEKLAAFAAEGPADVEPLLSDIDTVYYKSIFGELLHNKVTKAYLSGTTITVVLAADEEGKPSTMKIFKDRAQLQTAEYTYFTAGNFLIKLTPESEPSYQLMLASHGNSARRLQAENSDLVASGITRVGDRVQLEEVCAEMAQQTMQARDAGTGSLTADAQKFCDLDCSTANGCTPTPGHCQSASFRALPDDEQSGQLLDACKHEGSWVLGSIQELEDAFNDGLANQNSGRRLSEAYGSVRPLKTRSSNQTSLPSRRLGNYGWCSMALDFVLGGDDTANYCDATQNAATRSPSSSKPEDRVSRCCIRHDQCLQTTEATGTCNKVDCRGQECDKNIKDCAMKLSCWYPSRRRRWSMGYNAGCGISSTAIVAAFSGAIVATPQSGWNTGGANSDSPECDGL